MKKIMDELMLRGINIMVNGHVYMVYKHKDKDTDKSYFHYHGITYVDENLMLHSDDMFIDEDRDAINKILEVL